MSAGAHENGGSRGAATLPVAERLPWRRDCGSPSFVPLSRSAWGAVDRAGNTPVALPASWAAPALGW
ncbi:MAG: hypothetical protein H6Q90_293 [Deltaproteobacteria bacterium]|nr:hypothetical protein [Deltaproteobacteria bacterium]